MRARAAAADAEVVEHLRSLADLRHRDPEAVHDQARAIVEQLPPTSVALATGLWVLGLADHELGRPTAAVSRYHAAADLAAEHGDVHTEALARASMAISLLSLSDTAAATIEIGRAISIAPPSARGLVDLLAALVLQRTGRLEDALVAYARSLSRLRRDGDAANTSRLLLNRGTLRAYQGHFADALLDLAESERLATDLELWVLVAMAAHNLGFTEGRRGSVPAALAAFDRAEAAYATQGDPSRLVAALAADRCEVFLSVGLTRDAVGAARRALQLLGEGGDAMHRSEARLLLARALLASGELEDARVAARDAARSFRSARRGPWAAQAEYLALQAEILALQDLGQPPSAGVLTRARHLAELLDGHGWPVESMHVRTFVARVALALDRPAEARTALAGLGRSGPHTSAQLRVDRWHATALLRLAEGDRSAAKRALRRGLDVVDEHRAVLGATELRASATAHGTELARLGLRLAVADGRPWEVLRWAERWRAGALRLPRVTPPDDAALEDALRELRDVRAAQRDAALAGAVDRALAARIASLEATVRSRTMRGAQAGTFIAAAATLDLAALREGLGASTLVELVAVDGRVLAITVADGQAHLHDLAASATVTEEQRFLRFALRRALTTPLGSPEGARAATGVADAASRLDEMLLRPLALADGHLVIVPTGALHGVSWATLPTATGRSITVAPSAELWCRRRRSPTAVPGERTALVAGPDLPGGEAELDELAGGYPAAAVLRGAGATVEAVLDAFERADLVHLAAHGSFRADSPLFSSLQLADGPLTVYDLERLRSVPATVILPACDAALSDVQAGDELLGTATAMLGLGVASVVAPVLPVPDGPTTELMVALHAGLRRGAGPSAALADAAGVFATDAHRQAVAAAFVCIGGNDQAS